LPFFLINKPTAPPARSVCVLRKKFISSKTTSLARRGQTRRFEEMGEELLNLVALVLVGFAVVELSRKLWARIR
jgi:hypothetical protein